MRPQVEAIGASFRDPSGFLFVDGSTLYRQVNTSYQDDYLLLMSGLYGDLTAAGLLIEHEEVSHEAATPLAFRIIRPRRLPFISYPYEWSFSQLKAAALLTLEIQRRALERGMSLKDASAYNVQFDGWQPIFVDSLSFQKYHEGAPWPAYRQFCQHFLAPLALMSYTGWPLNQLLRIHLDGLPLGLAAKILPTRTRLRPSLLTHIHLHAMAQKRLSDRKPRTGREMGRMALLGLLSSLEGAVRKLTWRASESVWGEYYDQTNYGKEAFEHKQQLLQEFLKELAPQPAIAWDLGGNTGLYSRIVARNGTRVISFDFDLDCVEQNYLQCCREKDKLVIPLVLDLANPSPAQGWDHEERMSLLERGPADLALALALVHHLAIANNVPLGRVARFLARCARALVVEFVPKSDSQVARLLSGRQDIFPEYVEAGFERAFEEHFTILRRERIKHCERVLYLMKTR